jgi:hypothetical protein
VFVASLTCEHQYTQVPNTPSLPPLLAFLSLFLPWQQISLVMLPSALALNAISTLLPPSNSPSHASAWNTTTSNPIFYHQN